MNTKWWDLIHTNWARGAFHYKDGKPNESLCNFIQFLIDREISWITKHKHIELMYWAAGREEQD